ncbi:hypothetical protein C8Q75DRAFT_787393 [Abortiporus biennis]|nr:hypothetical protein C8Q75DRAFT_787393 [Abortiporus biennis]
MLTHLLIEPISKNALGPHPASSYTHTPPHSSYVSKMEDNTIHPSDIGTSESDQLTGIRMEKCGCILDGKDRSVQDPLEDAKYILPRWPEEVLRLRVEDLARDCRDTYPTILNDVGDEDLEVKNLVQRETLNGIDLLAMVIQVRSGKEWEFPIKYLHHANLSDCTHRKEEHELARKELQTRPIVSASQYAAQLSCYDISDDPSYWEEVHERSSQKKSSCPSQPAPNTSNSPPNGAGEITNDTEMPQSYTNERNVAEIVQGSLDSSDRHNMSLITEMEPSAGPPYPNWADSVENLEELAYKQSYWEWF